MAAKKKNVAGVQFGDFDLDKIDVERIRNERAGAAERVATFNQSFTPTGDAFKDTGRMSGTSRDVKNIRVADALLDRAADRGATVRGQDVELELGRGELGVNTERNRITEKYYDQNYEVEKGGLGLNRDIFDQSVARYNKYGEPMDKINTTNAAMKSQYVSDEIGIKTGKAFETLAPEFLNGDGVKVAKPTKIMEEADIQYNNVPDEQRPDFDSSTAFPEYLRKKDYSQYQTPLLGALNEGVKSLGRGIDLGLQYARPVEDILLGMEPGTSARAIAKPRERNKLRRRVIK